MTAPLLEIRNLSKHFPITSGLFRKEVGRIRAVNDVSFHIAEGETLGLVGGERLRQDHHRPPGAAAPGNARPATCFSALTERPWTWASWRARSCAASAGTCS